jgi:hypothetical protein
VLNGRLSLHDIRDAEAFCQPIAQQAQLTSHHDREELLAYLITELWILSKRYEPGGITFSTWAGHTLRQRTYDWQRTRYGRTTWQFKDRTYTRKLPEFVSYEHELTRNNHGPGSDQHKPTKRLVRAITQTPGDPSTHSVSDIAGLLRTRGSTEAWDNHPDSPRLPRRTED